MHIEGPAKAFSFSAKKATPHPSLSELKQMVSRFSHVRNRPRLSRFRAVRLHVARGRGMGFVVRGAIPLRFQGGVAAPLIKRARSLAAQTGWLVIQTKYGALRGYLRRLRDLLITTPSAPLRNGSFLLRRRHPSLETGGNELASTAVIDFEIACLGQSPKIRRYAHYNHSFRNLWDGSNQFSIFIRRRGGK